jgi:hypothetical protein
MTTSLMVLAAATVAAIRSRSFFAGTTTATSALELALMREKRSDDPLALD